VFFYILCGHEDGHNNSNHNDHDPPKEVSNRGSIAYFFVVPEIERSVESEELHSDPNGDDTGGEDPVPTPVAGASSRNA
jgi:hypothetical protein